MGHADLSRGPANRKREKKARRDRLHRDKRNASRGDKEAIISLLSRSVSLGHDRLAFYRYCLARALDDPRAEQYRDYCETAAGKLRAEERDEIRDRACRRAERFPGSKWGGPSPRE